MTAGLSGTYALNGVDLTLQPTSGKWADRVNYGIDGGAHPVYAQNRAFELSWDLISTEDAKQLIDVYNLVSNTGTITACLPQWGALEYQFKNYSGTTLEEPIVGEYFMGYIQQVRMLVLNVNTTQP